MWRCSVLLAYTSFLKYNASRAIELSRLTGWWGWVTEQADMGAVRTKWAAAVGVADGQGARGEPRVGLV